MNWFTELCSLLILNCIFFSVCMIFRVHILQKLVGENPPFRTISSLAYVSSVWQRLSDRRLSAHLFVCLFTYTLLFTFLSQFQTNLKKAIFGERLIRFLKNRWTITLFHGKLFKINENRVEYVLKIFSPRTK